MRRCGTILSTALAVIAASAAFAGGLGDDHGEGTDSIFFGVVKDGRGATISGARVTLKFKNMSFVTTSDAIGGYRLSTITDPNQSEISCSKDGYGHSETIRRSAAGSGNGPVEIDCTLQRAPQ